MSAEKWGDESSEQKGRVKEKPIKVEDIPGGEEAEEIKKIDKGGSMNIKSSGNAWMPAVIMAVVVAVIGGVFITKWSPSKADVTDAKASVATMQSMVQGYNETIRDLQFKVSEHDNKFDSMANSPYVTLNDLNAKLTPYAKTTDLTTLQQSIDSKLNTSPVVSSPTGLALNTTYDGANLVFGITKTGNSTMYFTIEGTVYYDTIPPFTPTPTPMLSGFNKTFSIVGMDQFRMTTYGKTTNGGSKGYGFIAPVGTWYYEFKIVPLSVGGNVSGGSSW